MTILADSRGLERFPTPQLELNQYFGTEYREVLNYELIQ